MTVPPGPPRHRPSLLLTILRVVVILAGLILLARLVPLAIRAIGAAGRAGFQAIGRVHPLWWILGALLVATVVMLSLRRDRRP